MSQGPSIRLGRRVSLLAFCPRPLTLTESKAREGWLVPLMPSSAGMRPAVRVCCWQQPKWWGV